MQLFDRVSKTAANTSSQISVSISNLTKSYPIKNRSVRGNAVEYLQANNDISLEIRKGEIFGLLGPNGAGKTTLVNQILGLSRPDKGSLTVEGIDAVSRPEKVKQITSYLPQQGTAFGSLEVRRALVYTGQLRGIKPADANQQATRLIKMLELEEVAERYLNHLSGGMKRMVGLAMALMGNSQLLVLDEPTNELDPARRRLVWEVIRRVINERTATCILVTHNVLEAESILERVAIINKGKVQALGSPGELKQAHFGEARLDLALKSQVNPGDLIMDLGDLPVKFDLLDGQYKNFRFYCQTKYAGKLLDTVIGKIGLEQIDDFKLALPSLEDIYLHLVDENNQFQNEDMEVMLG